MGDSAGVPAPDLLHSVTGTMLAPDWAALRRTFVDLQRDGVEPADVRSANSNVEVLNKSAAMGLICPPDVAAALAEDICLAVSNILRHLATPAFSLFSQDRAVQQGLVNIVVSAGFAGILHRAGFSGQRERLRRSHLLPAWSDAAVRIATALQHHRQQLPQQVQMVFPAIDVAGALLTFWVPFATWCRSSRAIDSYAPTIVSAAQLAAAILHTWPPLSSRDNLSSPTALEINGVIKAALDTGNVIATTLDLTTSPATTEDLLPGLVADDAVLLVVTAHLAYNTMVLHKQCNGLAAAQVATAARSRASPGTTAVSADHAVLLAALNLDRWAHIESYQAANSSTISGSCRALSLLLTHRFKRKQQQGPLAVIQECTTLDRLRTPLLRGCVEQLLLLGPTKDIRCTIALLELVQHLLWLGREQPTAAVHSPTETLAAAARKVEREHQLLLLLQLGPLVLAAAKEGTATTGSAQVNEKLRADVLLLFTRTLLAIAAAGGSRCFAASFHIAPLTTAVVLEAVVRSQGLQHQKNTSTPAPEAASGASASGQPRAGGSAPLWTFDEVSESITAPMLLYMIQQVLVSMPSSAAAAGTQPPQCFDQSFLSPHTARKNEYPPSLQAEAQATLKEGLLLVQLPDGGPSSQAMCCLLLSCLKYATAVCNMAQPWHVGVNIAILALSVVDAETQAFDWATARHNDSSSSNKEYGRYAAVLSVIGVRCCQLLSSLLEVGIATNPLVSHQQQPLQTCDQVGTPTHLQGGGVYLLLTSIREWLISRLVCPICPSVPFSSIPDSEAEFLHQQLDKLEQAMLAQSVELPDWMMASMTFDSGEHERYMSLPFIFQAPILLGDTCKPLRAIASKVQQQLPVRCCCNYAGCTKLDGLGELESVSRPGTRCSECKAAYYCTPACQKAAWKEHKPVCARLKTTPMLASSAD